MLLLYIIMLLNKVPDVFLGLWSLIFIYFIFIYWPYSNLKIKKQIGYIIYNTCVLY